jgi:acetolactate synthase-1/2/3 large subunit
VADRVYTILARTLIADGPSEAFGLMGEDTAALATELAEAGVAYYNARHEAVAVAMADGYSWATGGLGLCLISRGPGLTNALTAIRSAVRGKRRVLLIAGAPSTRGGHSPDPKQVDERAVADSVGLVYVHLDDPAAAEERLEEALESANGGRPALLAVAADILNGPAGTPKHSGRRLHNGSAVRETASPSPDDVRQIAELLAGSERPLILAGRGAAGVETKPLLEALAARVGGLLGTSLLARGLFDGAEYNLGVVGGFASDRATPVLEEIDCVLAFGASLNTFTTARRTLFRNARIVHVDIEPAALGAHHPVDLAIVADAGRTAQALLDVLPASPTVPRPLHEPEALERLRGPLYDGPDDSTATAIDPRVAASVLDAVLPRRRTVVLDSGAFMAYPAKYVRDAGQGTFRQTSDFGSIGQGLGTALGVAVARADSAIVLFIGDGGMMMTLGDLETAVRYEIPLIVVVMNDHAYGAEKALLAELGVDDRYAIFPETDFALVAEGLGMEAVAVRTEAELRALVDALDGRTAPLLIDCKINPDVAADWLRG